MALLGTTMEVVEMPIVKANELYNEYTLEDGTFVKVKNVATSIVQVVGQTMPDGSPVLLIFSSPVVNVVSFPK